MTGGIPSEPAEGTQYGELPEFEGDTDFDVSRPQSCTLRCRSSLGQKWIESKHFGPFSCKSCSFLKDHRIQLAKKLSPSQVLWNDFAGLCDKLIIFTAARVSAFGSDDEEFESVSQVTGPVSLLRLFFYSLRESKNKSSDWLRQQSSDKNTTIYFCSYQKLSLKSVYFGSHQTNLLSGYFRKIYFLPQNWRKTKYIPSKTHNICSLLLNGAGIQYVGTAEKETCGSQQQLCRSWNGGKSSLRFGMFWFSAERNFLRNYWEKSKWTKTRKAMWTVWWSFVARQKRMCDRDEEKLKVLSERKFDTTTIETNRPYVA